MLRIIDQLLYCQEAIIRTNIERHHKHLTNCISCTGQTTEHRFIYYYITKWQKHLLFNDSFLKAFLQLDKAELSDPVFCTVVASMNLCM